jgi:quercetin dioxygenase-like cupin family protein
MHLYAWNSLPEEPLNPRASRKAVHTANMTVARIELRKDAVVPEHSHPHEQVSMVQKGTLKFRVDGKEQVVRAGEFLAIPPHAPHSVEAVEDSTVLDLFSPAREDWIRGDDSYLRR